MDKLYRKGELLQLHTKNSEVIEGRFYNMTSDKSKISLYNVKELPQDKSEGIFHYYDSEVREIVKIQDPGEKTQLNVLQKDCKDIKLGQQTHLKISQKEFEDIIMVSKKLIYINQVDSSFHEAMKDLESYSYIALSTDGANMGRKCKMPFLVLSTPHQIYIFDTQVMQYHAFDAGLKKLLESESPKKIVHDCRKISDCFYHKHNVKLNSVFDTQVGDLIITRNKKGGLPNTVKSLSECLNSYLGLQLDTIEEKLNVMQCTERPLALKLKETLAKNIAFQHRLSEFIHEEMMLPFVRGVECYIDYLRSCDDLKAWKLCGNHNQLPKEFKSAIDY